jgi:hypothetical protein
MKTNLDIVNNVTLKHAKFQYEILNIIGYTKMINYVKICRFEKIHNRSTRFVIFV